jgi:hypothetical protein
MMKWDAWRFSTKLAWQDRVIRWVLLATLVFFVGWSVFLLWRLIPEGTRSGVLILHYNIYLGIDDVRSWPWIFLFPGIMLGVLGLNTGFAVSLFRTDVLAARSLVILSAFLTAIWAIASFFLILVNL